MSAPSEAELLRVIRKALNEARDEQGRYRCRVVRNSVGFDQERRVRYGLGLGSADLVGITRGASLGAQGRVIALEVKRTGAAPRIEQIAWLRALRAFGGYAAIVHSPAEAMAALEAAERGEISPPIGGKILPSKRPIG